MKILIFSLLLTFGAGKVFAFEQGSLSKDQALSEVCAESVTLCSYLKALNISDQGNAIRLPNGERIMPYRFSFAEDHLSVEIARDSAGRINILVQEANPEL